MRSVEDSGPDQSHLAPPASPASPARPLQAFRLRNRLERRERVSRAAVVAAYLLPFSVVLLDLDAEPGLVLASVLAGAALLVLSRRVEPGG